MNQAWAKVEPTLTPRNGDGEGNGEGKAPFPHPSYVPSYGESTVVLSHTVVNSQFSVSISSHGKCGHEQKQREKTA